MAGSPNERNVSGNTGAGKSADFLARNEKEKLFRLFLTCRAAGN
jgi:hypothetical protein